MNQNGLRFRAPSDILRRNEICAGIIGWRVDGDGTGIALNGDLQSGQIALLLRVALRAPDRALVGFVLRGLVAHPLEATSLLSEAVAAVAEEDIAEFLNLVRRFGQLGQVLPLLRNGPTEVRRALAVNLGWVTDEQALAALERAAAEDQDERVREAAAVSRDKVKAWGTTELKTISLEETAAPDERLIGLLLGANGEVDGFFAALNDLQLSSKMRRAIAGAALPVFRGKVDRVMALVRNSRKWPSDELIEALGKLGDGRAVAWLLNLKTQPGETRSAICRALAAIGTTEAAQGLAARLTQNGYYAAPAALKSMGKIAATPLLEEYLRDERVRETQGELLASVLGADALGPLTDALREPNEKVRENAEKGLITLGWLVVEPMLKLLEAGYVMVRPHVIRVLGAIGDERAVPALVGTAAQGPEEDRLIALQALRHFRSATVIAFLKSVLESGIDKARREAAYALARSGDAAMTNVIWEAAKDDREAIRIAAVEGLRVLAYMGDTNAFRELDRALNETSERVSEAAERALLWLEDWSPTSKKALKQIGEGVGAPISRKLADLQQHGPKAPHVLHSPAGEATLKIPEVRLDEVQFTAILPDKVKAGDAFLVDFWVHLEELREEVTARATKVRTSRVFSRGPIKLARDTVVQIRFGIPAFRTAEIEESVVWLGRLGNASFPVQVPREAEAGTHIGYCDVYVGPLRVSKIYFEVNVGAVRGVSTMQRLKQKRVRSAFASYATEDRHEVLARMQGMLKVVPKLDIFMDVLTLRSGEQWAARINEEIAARDIFYLFWSVAAIRSRWVEREWRTALETRGLDHIDPVPLQPPSIAPPPLELAGLHFSDWLLAADQGWTAKA